MGSHTIGCSGPRPLPSSAFHRRKHNHNLSAPPVVICQTFPHQDSIGESDLPDIDADSRELVLSERHPHLIETLLVLPEAIDEVIKLLLMFVREENFV